MNCLGREDRQGAVCPWKNQGVVSFVPHSVKRSHLLSGSQEPVQFFSHSVRKTPWEAYVPALTRWWGAKGA
jgi:hypothetical protein